MRYMDKWGGEPWGSAVGTDARNSWGIPDTPVVVALVEPALRDCLELTMKDRAKVVHTRTVAEALSLSGSAEVGVTVVSTHATTGTRYVAGPHGSRSSAHAVVSESPDSEGDVLLSLGAHGPRCVLNLCRRESWGYLRAAVALTTPVPMRAIRHRLHAELAACPEGVRQFFDSMALLAPRVRHVEDLTRNLGIGSTTFNSRFLRRSIPSPREYLSGIRLAFAAALLESSAVSVRQAAVQLNYSSANSFARHVMLNFGLTAVAFRRKYTGAGFLSFLVSELITPYLEECSWRSRSRREPGREASH